MIDMMITCGSGEVLSRGYAGFDTAIRAAEQEAFRLGEPVFVGLATGGPSWEVRPDGAVVHPSERFPFTTLDDIAADVAERFGCLSPYSIQRVRNAIQNLLPMQYNKLVIHEGFLRAVWARSMPGRYPF